VDKRVTIHTIAEKLGISSTTVYRALNNKPKVNEKTKKAILELVKEEGFKPNTLAQSLARKTMRIAILLTTNFPEFHNKIIDGVKQATEELKDYNVAVDFYVYEKGDTQSPRGKKYFHDAIRKILRGSYSGLMSTGGINDLREYELIRKQGIPMAFVVTDYNVKRKFCIRYNGRVAGMMAGELFYWRLGKRAKVAVASGFDQISIHHETVNGFLAQMEITPLKLITILYNEDEEELSYNNTNKLLQEHPDIKGIYVNSFNSSGVIRSVIEHGLGGKICLITSDINDEIRRCLVNGIVSATIFQNQYNQGLMGMKYLYRSISENLPVDDTILLNPEIIFRSNMDLYK
jgi:LacI family transcriptional regulator